MNDIQKKAVERVARARGHWDETGSGFPPSTPEDVVQHANQAVKLGIKSADVKAVLEAAGQTVDWEPPV